MNDPQSTAHYREILKEELVRRQTRNPGYSQRAFARDLGIRSNRLSEILRGKQGISPQLAVTVAERLTSSEAYRSLFLYSVMSEHSRTEVERERAVSHLRQILFERNIEAETGLRKPNLKPLLIRSKDLVRLFPVVEAFWESVLKRFNFNGEDEEVRRIVLELHSVSQKDPSDRS